MPRQTYVAQFAAGAVGRGNFAQHWYDMGLGVTFIEPQREVIEAMNRDHSYPLKLVGPKRKETIPIHPVRALHPGQIWDVMGIIYQSPFVGFAVPEKYIEGPCQLMAAYLNFKRYHEKDDKPTNMILALNKPGGADFIRGKIEGYLSGDGKKLASEENLGIAHTVIARMGPTMDPAVLKKHPTLFITEDYYTVPTDAKGWVGKRPDIPGVLWVEDHFDAWEWRKIQFHNFWHAVIGYTGIPAGLAHSPDVLNSPEILENTNKALDIAQAVIKHKFPGVFTKKEAMRPHRIQLGNRIYNRDLNDDLARLVNGPIRKLGPNDRLAPVLVYAFEQMGMSTKELHPIITAMAQGYHYSNPADTDPKEGAVALQEKLRRSSIEDVVAEVSGIPTGHELNVAISDEFRRLAS